MPEFGLGRAPGLGGRVGAVACFVYLLGSKTGGRRRTYVGWTTDPEQRLRRHNDGSGARSTRGRQWRLLYLERYQTRGEAMSREWHLKRDRRFRKHVYGNVFGGE